MSDEFRTLVRECDSLKKVVSRLRNELQSTRQVQDAVTSNGAWQHIKTSTVEKLMSSERSRRQQMNNISFPPHCDRYTVLGFQAQSGANRHWCTRSEEAILRGKQLEQYVLDKLRSPVVVTVTEISMSNPWVVVKIAPVWTSKKSHMSCDTKQAELEKAFTAYEKAKHALKQYLQLFRLKQEALEIDTDDIHQETDPEDEQELALRAEVASQHEILIGIAQQSDYGVQTLTTELLRSYRHMPVASVLSSLAPACQYQLDLLLYQVTHADT